MRCRLTSWLALALIVALVGCQTTVEEIDAMYAESGEAGEIVLAAPEARPWKGRHDWFITDVEWASGGAGPLPGTVSDFDGRCSVPSDYIAAGTGVGQLTHMGRVTGVSSHCGQFLFSPDGDIIGKTYTDGTVMFETANGSSVTAVYPVGTAGVDPVTGRLFILHEYTIVGGTGHFDGATGGGWSGGTFADLFALMSGDEIVDMWLDGTITYQPGRAAKD